MACSILTAPRSKRYGPLDEEPLNLMCVLVCLVLVDIGFIQQNISSLLIIISVNGHGTFRFLSKAQLIKIAFKFDST